MKHYVSTAFWSAYHALPLSIQRVADRNFELIKADPRHPSLHFKKVGKFWSARVGLYYRALAVEVDGNMLWIWIGSHSDYDKLVR